MAVPVLTIKVDIALMINKRILGLACGVMCLAGCTITRQDAGSMSPAESYYCSIDGGIHYAFGFWYKYDSQGYCRKRTAELESAGQMMDTDKVQALRAGAGL